MKGLVNGSSPSDENWILYWTLIYQLTEASGESNERGREELRRSEREKGCWESVRELLEASDEISERVREELG